MKNVKYSVCEREYKNGEYTNNIIRESTDWFEASKFCSGIAEQWAKDGLIVDSFEGNEFVAHDPNTYELVHDYLICIEYVPQVGAIDPSIVGYEFVKDVVYAGGSSMCDTELLFAVRDCGDDLRGLCEVRENNRSNWDELHAKYTLEDGYYVLSGCVRTLSKGCAVMPSGGDIIEFYLS